jgi:N-acetylmuramic acid 6-phosphate etherase
MLVTEQRNRNSLNISEKDTLEILRIINSEDQKVAVAIRDVLHEIADVVDIVVRSFKCGGRLFYVGAGTSGRIGLIDAAECPPTFGVDPSMVQAIIAGGKEAMYKAVELAEDDEKMGAESIQLHGVNSKDIIVGISASGQTQFVLSALAEAKEQGASTVLITNNPVLTTRRYIDIYLKVIVGPEVITGSTRMKAATAQKMVVNMISTASMIRLGRVYDNLMVYVHPENMKLKDRAIKMIMAICNVDNSVAADALQLCDNRVQEAIKLLKQTEENGLV